MDVWQTSETDGATEYTRTDVAEARTNHAWSKVADTDTASLALVAEAFISQARIKELESLLLRAADDIEKGWLSIEGVEETYNTDGSWHVVQDIRTALKGEET